MITSSILNSITFKKLAAVGEHANMWNTLHVNRAQGGSRIIPYYQKFNKDHVVRLQFGSDSSAAITLKSYCGQTEIDSITNSFDSHYGTTDSRYYTNFVVTLGASYYDKNVYFKAIQGDYVMTSEPIMVYDLTDEIAKGTIKYIRYTNKERLESDLDDRFIDWSILTSTGKYLDFFIDAVDIKPNDTDESEILEGSQSKTILSSSYYSGKVLDTGGIPDYMVSRLGVASSLDIFTVNGIQYIKQGEISQDRFGNSTLYQVSLKLTQKNALGINIDMLYLISGAITSQTNVSVHGLSDGAVTVSGSGGTAPYEYSIGGSYQSSGTFSGLAAGNYTVIVRDAGGVTCNIAITITQPPIVTLAGPDVSPATNVTVQGFVANWIALTNATKYRLDVAIDSDFNTMVSGYNNLDVNLETSHVVSGLDGRTNYYYRVRAEVGGYLSDNSDIVTVSPVLDHPVARFAYGVTGTSFFTAWDNGTPSTGVLGATGYHLDVSETSDFSTFITGFENKDVSNVLAFEVTGLTAGLTYYYRVRAYNGYQISENSGVISQVMMRPPSNPIAQDPTSVTHNSFIANWLGSTFAGGYILQVATDINFGTIVLNQQIVGSDVLSFEVTNLISEKLYFYRVQAFKPFAVPVYSGYSETVAVKTLMPVIEILAPTNIYSKGFTVNWKLRPTATSYFIDVATTATFDVGTVVVNNVDMGNVNTYNITDLTANTQYYYRIRATNGIELSANSAVATLATQQAPNVPPAYAATFILSDGFQANWDFSLFADGYHLDIATDSGFTSKVTGYDNKVVHGLSYPVTGLSSLTPYYYRVRAFDEHGIITAYSSIITVATLGLVPMPPVPKAPTSIGTDRFTANWNAVTGATGYKLYVATNMAFTNMVSGFNGLDVGNVLTYPVTGLLPNSGYYYRLVAYNAVGDGSPGTVQGMSTSALPMPTISLNYASSDFEGYYGNRLINVVTTNATSWGINWPSLNGYLHIYSSDANSVTLYYDGPIDTYDTIEFYAVGPGGYVTTLWSGGRIS